MNSLGQSSHKLVDMQKSSNVTDALVLPGDVIATAEEYLPGRNAAESNGYVVSLIYGSVRKDDKNLTVSVSPVKKKLSVHVGEIAYGKVTKTDQRHASVKVGAVLDKDLGLVEYTAEGSIGLSSQFDKNGNPNIHIGDIVRTKILRIGDRGFELGIFGKNLGVLRTLCSKCRIPLQKKDSSLYCDNCERSEIRKVAEDYGMIDITGEWA